MIKYYNDYQESLKHIIEMMCYDIIEEVWKEDPEEYSIEVLNAHLVNISDFYIWFNEIEWICKYDIPRDIVWEWLDSTHLNFDSDRVKEYKESLKDVKDFNWNLIWFFNFIS